MTDSKREAERLMNDLLPFAKQMLTEYGEFHPFGGFIRADGSIVQVGVDDPRSEFPKASELLEIMRSDFRRRAIQEGITAAAVVFNVAVVAPGSREKTDAIQVTVEHRASYCADVFIPYRLRTGGVLEFGTSFAQQGTGRVFLSK